MLFAFTAFIEIHRGKMMVYSACKVCKQQMAVTPITALVADKHTQPHHGRVGTVYRKQNVPLNIIITCTANEHTLSSRSKILSASKEVVLL